MSAHPKHWIFQDHIPLPDLPKEFDDPEAHDRLISDFLNWSGNFAALARKHGLSVDQFDRWFHADATQERLRKLEAIAEARSRTLARIHRAAAIDRLAEVVEDSRSHGSRERVRAAIALLREAQLHDRAEKTRTKDTPGSETRGTSDRAGRRTEIVVTTTPLAFPPAPLALPDAAALPPPHPASNHNAGHEANPETRPETRPSPSAGASPVTLAGGATPRGRAPQAAGAPATTDQRLHQRKKHRRKAA